jgi:hypothetical protein
MVKVARTASFHYHDEVTLRLVTAVVSLGPGAMMMTIGR